MAEIAITVQGTPWIIDDVNLTVRRDTATSPLPDLTNSADRVTTQQLYSALQNRFDEPDLLDSTVPMSAQTPNAFTMINGWFIDEESIRYLTGGAITSNGWNGVIRKLTLDAVGYTGPTTADLGLTVSMDGSGDTGTLIGFRNDTREWWVRVTTGGSPANLFPFLSPAGVQIAASTSSPIPQGNMTKAAETGEYLYTNLFTLGTIEANTDLYVIQDGQKLLPQFWATGQIDILVKVQDSGVLIDEGRVFVFARQYSKLYDNFDTDLSVGGRQPVPLATGNDLNNATGIREAGFAQNSPELSLAVGDVLQSGGVNRAIVTSISGSLLRYYLIFRDASTGNFIDPGQQSPLETLTAVGKTGSITLTSNSIEFGPAQQSVSPLDFFEAQTRPTLSFGAVSQNLGTGTPNSPYSISINCQGATLAQMYEWAKQIAARNERVNSSPSLDEIYNASDLVAGNAVEGEQYKGIEVRIDLGGQSSPTYTEGELVTGGTSGATGIVVGNHVLTAEGNFVTLRDTQGTFQAAETLTGSTSAESQTISSVTSVAPTKQSPLGTFAGGTFFGAPGVYITNMAAADIQNYQLIDDDGNVQTPPNAVAITVRGLVSGDRVGVFRLDAPQASSGQIVRNRFTLLAGSPDNIQGATTLTVATTGASPNTIPFDTTGSGVVRVRDVSATAEQRYRYASFSGNVFTLVSIPDASADAGSTGGTVLQDAGSTFVTSGVQIGDVVYNQTDGSEAVVLEVIDENNLRTTQLTGGTGNDYGTGDVVTINKLSRNYVNGTDTAYDMLLDVIADTTVETSDTLIFLSSIDARVVVRFSSPIISPFEPIEPFVTGGTVGSGGLDVTAIRNPDGIATAA